ncbi:MAG: phosphoenolpyruvate synthase [Thermoleophilia bacterium]|nr:phosphoenolpyruvate synthase [Thermoleophilia bacterium]
MGSHVVRFEEIDATRVAETGGKGASLGALSRIPGVAVPPGFCVTTGAFRRALAGAPAARDALARLAGAGPDDGEALRGRAAELRRAILAAPVPADVAAEVTDALARLGGDTHAVRSSATAEDLPTASFAGQHDSYLDVAGPEAVVEHVRRCWASLFTDRAVAYRLRNGIRHDAVAMAVVVQRMVHPDAAGVLFTADPVTSNRRIAVVEAVPGSGESPVSGRAAADTFRVRDGRVLEASVAAGRGRPVLTGGQALRLAGLGRLIEARLGGPQDIEWCLAGDEVHVVQSRPITTLFPVPEAPGDGNRVYLSVGHQQMMTDAMRPLGLSMWQLIAMAPMHAAGGRLFVDAAPRLAAPAARAGLLEMVGRSDPLTRDALETLLGRGDGFVGQAPDPAPAGPPPGGPPAPPEPDAAVVADLVARNAASVAALERDIRAVSGPEVFTFIEEDIRELKRLLTDPASMRVIMAGMDAAWWLGDRMEEWLGERNAVDVLSRSAPGNVTARMGLDLLDVADAVRPHPEAVAVLEGARDDAFLDDLAGVEGGPAARDAIRDWLGRYGARCVGEIDITRPRWGDHPVALVPLILGNVRNFPPGEGRRRFEDGLRQAAEAERDLLGRLRALPDGHAKAAQAEDAIGRLRAFIGYREYPKYGIVRRMAPYRRALMAEAARLVRAGVLDDAEDAFFLTFGEFADAVRARRADRTRIARRRDEFRWHGTLTPPRVLTSEGETLNGAYRREDVPAGALTGLAVSVGTVEGRARVVLDIASADLAPGDILVTPHTDPSWTPAFVTVAGLVTEVGGVMTHGAVIAREYGLPAVVGVADATRRIRDGQRIRVHGAAGYVEPLPEAGRASAGEVVIRP